MRLKHDHAAIDKIVEGCRKGDNEAFSALIDRYSKRFYGYFYSHTFDRQVSDDLLSEFYLKIVKSIKSFKSGSFEAWMQSVASSVYYDYLRKHIRERDNNLKYCEEKAYLDDINSTEQPESEDQSDALHTALDELDGDSRELISLRYFSDMSFKEIAEATGRPIGTVLAKIHRGISKLKKNMEVKK
jgi:RNA polymerase sigma-70 factor (ECF subfamily)